MRSVSVGGGTLGDTSGVELFDVFDGVEFPEFPEFPETNPRDDPPGGCDVDGCG